MNDYRQTTIQHHLWRRARIIQSVRFFFISRGYLEVETPIRIPAPAPERHIDPLPTESWCLQTSPELCMKRLLSAGYPRIFQICKCFRARERGRRHLTEFTMLEWYTTNKGYFEFMDECEALIQAVASNLGSDLKTGRESETSLNYLGNTIELASPWHRISVPEAFERWSPIPLSQALATDRFDEIMVDAIEPNLGIGRPAFLYDYPAECASLAKLSPDNPELAQRFELYIHGIELCNAFMELTDPSEQRRRFKQEREAMRQRNKLHYPMPEPFLHALKDMPDAAGIALGIDRLVMLFANTDTIDEVVSFTTEEL